MQPFKKIEPAIPPENYTSMLQIIMERQGVDESAAKIVLDAEIKANSNCWKNDAYTVIIRDEETSDGFPEMLSLGIKRNDREAIHDWRELQKIKNMLIGEEHEAVELYPAESRLVDCANQYHLWVLKEKGLRFPFGLQERNTATSAEAEKVGAKQRNF